MVGEVLSLESESSEICLSCPSKISGVHSSCETLSSLTVVSNWLFLSRKLRFRLLKAEL